MPFFKLGLAFFNNHTKSIVKILGIVMKYDGIFVCPNTPASSNTVILLIYNHKGISFAKYFCNICFMWNCDVTFTLLTFHHVTLLLLCLHFIKDEILATGLYFQF